MQTQERPVSTRPATAPKPLPRSPAYGLKRVLLGPPLPTKALKHERLGKPTALAVFASDNLSSVAYATEEILKVGVPVVGLLAFSFLMPVTFAILGVLAILILSYRQTIKAYPSAGGAYIVTKDNLGLMPAQVAGVALLTDYVLTVSVSVAAGVAAIYAAYGPAFTYRVPLSVLFIWLIAWGNLRGVRESGRIFAAPTYFFIVMMILLLGVGLIRALTGTLHPLPVPADVAETTGAISLFLLLHAFASGGAAVTGVEAISNGVPAFKPPAWKNARTTLVIMGSLLGTMFLGLSFLAFKLQTIPTETKTVISEVGAAVFGRNILWYLLLLATTMILILAANTSFADFPRLASFQASDSFMPRQLTKRGHRLVFSNGIVGLAAAATVLVVIFQADVHKLIPLYAIGVFTSFTLSQAGMAKRHLRLQERGWRSGLLINGLGAITTAVVTIVIAYTKFAGGAWAIMIFVPVLVYLLMRMNHRYRREHEELEEGLEVFDATDLRLPIALVLVDGLDHKTVHALQYAKTVRTTATHAIHFERGSEASEALQDQWNKLDFGLPLTIVKATSDLAGCLAGYIGALPQDAGVNVIIPAPARMGFLERLRRGRTGAQYARALLPYRRARITLVRDHEHDPAENGAGTSGQVAHLPRSNHKAVVLIDRVDRATLEAVKYALSLGAIEVWGLHAGADQGVQERMIERWIDLHIPVPLQLVECWDRNVARAVETYVVELMGGNGEITVVLPRRDYAQIRQRLLHDRTSRSISRALGRYAHVDVTTVPYYLSGRRRHTGSAAPATVR